MSDAKKPNYAELYKLAEDQLRAKDKEIADLKQQNADNLVKFKHVVDFSNAQIDLAKSNLINALKAIDDARIIVNAQKSEEKK